MIANSIGSPLVSKSTKYVCPLKTALAPMQDVTGLPFMKVIASRGAPDYFFTEFFRVHSNSRLKEEILRSITENTSGRPVVAQLIGENLIDLTRTVKDLSKYPIFGIDLNLGCPAPRVYKKNVGGGLLRNPDKIDSILSRLREEFGGSLSVKMRYGFEDDRNFDRILSILKSRKVDMVSLHARTVLGGYRTKPEYEYVKRASSFLECPVFLNGNVQTHEEAFELVNSTGASGAMIGRAAIRNPWIFRQIREQTTNAKVFNPKLKDVFEYVSELYEMLKNSNANESNTVARIKKFLNFVGLSIDQEGKFLFYMRRAKNRKELFFVFEEFLLEKGKGECFFSNRPFEGLLARPSCES